MIPQPAHEAQMTILFGSIPPIKSQYPWPYNPSNQTYRPQSIAKPRALRPPVVPEANQAQISTNPTILVKKD